MKTPTIKVDRLLYNRNCTVSMFTVPGKTVNGFGIEDEIRTVKVKGETAIPAGTYPLALRHSPKFSKAHGHEMIWIKDVPGFEFILIHTGNTDADTEGCYIVGSSVGVLNGKVAVLASKAIYEKLYAAVVSDIKKGGATIQFTNLYPLQAQ